MRKIKAYRYQVAWSDDVGTAYGETASKVRYDVFLDLSDSYDQIKFGDIRVWRAPAQDIKLPQRHRLADELTAAEQQIVLHSYGYQGRRPENAGYRNHYCTHPSDSRLHRLAWELGLFRGPYGNETGYGEVEDWCGVFYYLTDLGKHVARSMIPTSKTTGGA